MVLGSGMGDLFSKYWEKLIQAHFCWFGAVALAEKPNAATGSSA
jgi:hypothetical protein